MKKLADERQKLREEEIKNVTEFYDKQLTAMEKTEEARKKAFEAEQAWLAKYEDELIWKAIGIAARNAIRRSHGHSRRKRIATSNVAPPQHSTENRSGASRA